VKAFLLHPDRDVDSDAALPPNEHALIQDLGLDALFAAMASGDGFLLDAARHLILSSVEDPAVILYRQRVLTDLLENPDVARRMYDVTVQAIEGGRKIWRGSLFSGYPDATLQNSVEAMNLLVDVLRELRQLAEQHRTQCGSAGLSAFFERLVTELGEDYLQVVQDHLRELRFTRGVLLGASLGNGNKGMGYVLRRGHRRPSWRERLTRGERSSYTMSIADRDESGAKAVAELRERAINLAANALAQSVDSVVAFLTTLRWELGSYLACINLRERLEQKGGPVCFPVPAGPGGSSLTARGLYDVSLSVQVDSRLVGNDVTADGTSLIMVTGANQGGKSTFLRSVGLARLMMQCGMFVAAESFSASTSARLFTRYRREEDATMTSGKLDEELARMRDIVDQIVPGSVALFNESFAATNEREGSEIARQIIRGLLESGVGIVFVTHLFDLAHSLYTEHHPGSLFLRADRRDDGHRTFRLVEGEPLPTSYGPDLYDRIFGPSGGATPTLTPGVAPAST